MCITHISIPCSCCISYEKNNLRIYLNSTCNKTVTVMQILGKLIGASDLEIERSSTKSSIAPAVCPSMFVQLWKPSHMQGHEWVHGGWWYDYNFTPSHLWSLVGDPVP